MSQTKVKSRMYASKLLTERSPVAKRVMVAETNTDAPKSFCDAPGGTGHRDMARSESSARELGRPVPAQAGGGRSRWSRSSGEAGNDRGAKGSCLHGVSNGGCGTRLSCMDSPREKENVHVSRKKEIMVGAVHLARPGRNSRRKPMRGRGCVPVKLPRVSFGWKAVFVRKCADDGWAEAGERRRPARTQGQLVEFGIDTKNVL